MKIDLNIYELSFPHGLHLNKGRDNTEHSSLYLHSDSLLAALMQVYAQWGFNPEELKDVVLSSAFPFTKDGDHSNYFFPKVYFPKVTGFEQRAGFTKNLKQLMWLDHKSFEALANGNFQFKEEALQGSYYSSGKPPLIESSVRLRTRVGREPGEETKPYYIDELYFGAHSGLFFLTADMDAAQTKALERGLRMLEDSGIGTDRSVGKGSFSFQKSTLSLRLPQESNYSTNLGLFLPNDLEEWKSLSSGQSHRYELVQRGGWFDGSSAFIGKRKNSVNMIREGGLWHEEAMTTLRVRGRVANLAPQSLQSEGLSHPVYRSGRSLFFPLKIDQHEV